MAVRTSFTAGEVLAAADLTDTFGAKLNLAGGKVLQVVRATDTTLRSTTSTSFVDVTGMSVTITPQKSTSAVLLLAFFRHESYNATVDDVRSVYSITDSSNNGISGSQTHIVGSINITGTGTRVWGSAFALSGYVNPATTSAVTYKLRFQSWVSTTTTQVRNADATGQMYAIEVSA